MQSIMRNPAVWVILVAILIPCPMVAEETVTGRLDLQVVDATSGQPLAVRMRLKNQKGTPFKPPNAPFWRGHFVFDGKIVIALPLGDYTFEVEHGPEYRMRSGQFIVENRAEDVKQISMERFVDMKREGWWSGDLHVHRPVDHIELLMRADDLHVAPVITWWANRKSYRNLWRGKDIPDSLTVRFDNDRIYNVMAGEDERAGGALLYFGLKDPLPIDGSRGEYPSPVDFLKMARKHDGVHVDIEKPFWWDMPIWVASEMCDSIGLCNNHQWRDGVLATEAWGKPRDKTNYPDPLGNGRWSQDIYYHLLNCGLRIPPSAGSASGVLPNPVGYNRVYVYCGLKLDYNEWWKNLRAGRVVVTNGPMLLPKVNGQLPGHVFHSQGGKAVELEIEVKLLLRDHVDSIEIVQDGRVAQSMSLDQWANANGKLSPIIFHRSGWMLIRAVTNNPKTYRFASTGPYYVDIDSTPRISKQSAQFFLDWVQERSAKIKLDDMEELESVIKHHRAARDYWRSLVDKSNAE